MSQRYFITAEATYESLRNRLDAQLGYPNASGSSVIQPPIHAPRDGYRRVLIAVDSAIEGYAVIIADIESLVATDSMEELDEATYLASAANQSTVIVTLSQVATNANWGSVFLGGTDAEVFLAQLAINSLSDAIDAVGGLLIGSTSGLVVVTGANGAVGTLAQGTAGQVLKVNSTATGVEWGTAGAAAAVDVRSDTVGATTYTGRAAAGSATSASVWKIRRTVLTSAGAVSSTATATNVAWNDRLTASYS